MSPSIGASVLITNRRGPENAKQAGTSAPPYEWFNLGAGSGDDPAAVAANRAALAAHLELAPDHLVWMSQVHGAVVAEVTGPSADPIPGTDAMVTKAPGIALAVLVADCVPVLAADARAGVHGVAHAGRVGAAAGVVPAMLDRMVLLGAQMSDIAVLLGPAICGQCYEVPPTMRDDVEAALPGSACITERGTPGLDLRAGIRRQLSAAGIGSVESDERCTREDPQLFSHRRSAPTGRFAAVVRPERE